MESVILFWVLALNARRDSLKGTPAAPLWTLSLLFAAVHGLVDLVTVVRGLF